MSLWGATVITNLMSAIPWVGQDIVEFIWGGFSVNNATLNRFFALHFLLPFVLAALVVMHLIAYHDVVGSGNPLGISGNYDRLPFAPYFVFKDLITILDEEVKQKKMFNIDYQQYRSNMAWSALETEFEDHQIRILIKTIKKLNPF